MNELLLAWTELTVWYLLPLVVTVSLVYASTRHELMEPILHHALRIGAWILVFMGVVYLVVLLLRRAL